MPIPQAPLNVFIDSDGPVADFDHDLLADGRHTDIFKMLPGIYLYLPITAGAKQALSLLKEMDDKRRLRVWIATKTPSNSPYAYTEKILWYRKNFPWLEDRVIITHDKSMLGCENDILLDDRPHKANADKFRGTFVYFDTTKPAESWSSFLDGLRKRVYYS